jgi:hypothetical protein
MYEVVGVETHVFLTTRVCRFTPEEIGIRSYSIGAG